MLLSSMRKLISLSLAITACTTTSSTSKKTDGPITTGPTPISNSRQMTFEGQRAGEGYFSPDGRLMIFQSERESDNPFYQMYVKELATGKTHRVSPGYGKTTCGWILPDKKTVTFSSTHLDKNAKTKQLAEIQFRQSGQQRRYSWDYDENYEIFKSSLDGKNTINLTKTLGYDAESSASPDGKHIVFASNRSAYESTQTPEQKNILEKDPSYFMEIYIMNSDGSNLKRLTQTAGYDGGPFFSPDGQKIVWRRFAPDGLNAEVFTMNIDGSDAKQITNLKAMSWAPFYHPSGDYIIFTTNLHGYQNFELYIVDAKGEKSPVRVTYLDGFDGLPVFTPDGLHLTWNRKISATDSQIMIADWDDNMARRLLNLPPAPPSVKNMTEEITEADLKTIIKFLASKELKGRDTGSEGEQKSAQVISTYFKDIGLSPAYEKDYIQKFSFVQEAVLGTQNDLTIISNNQKSFTLNKDWRPLTFSESGEFAASPIVFAGYGIRAPGENKMAAYDSYAGLDVKDKWVMVLRYIPESVSAERRLYLQRYAKIQYKATLAKELGARGIIYVSGPTSNSKNDLIPFTGFAGLDMGIPSLSVTDEVAQKLLESVKMDLKSAQIDLDIEKSFTGFLFPNTKLSVKIDLHTKAAQGHNTVGILKIPGATQTLIIGAHGDHLGTGHADSSLKTSKDIDPIHYGADDNASGVSAVLELAHYFSKNKNEKTLPLKQNIIFAVWSGEELGNLGSSYFVKNLNKKIKLSAYINMDMIGRWKQSPTSRQYDPLLIQGIGSSDQWKEVIETAKLDFPVQLQTDPYLPTDATAFYLGKVPAINFFTGVHMDYHTPRDTEDKINYPGLKIITDAIYKIAVLIATKEKGLTYKVAPASSMDLKRSFRIYLGTIPDYAQEKISGVRLSGVVSGGPAEKAGLKGGDIIIQLASKNIENIHDYVFSLETIRPNEPTQIVVMRKGKRELLKIVPQAKE